LEENVQKKIILVKIFSFAFVAIALVAMAMNAPKVFKIIDKELSPSAKINTSQIVYNGEANIECLYYNIEDFIAIKEFEFEDFDEDIGTIRGLIVPHHLLAKDLIHEAFQSVIHIVKSQNNTGYKTIVVFGPDHESIERAKVFTSSSTWQSPMGILNAEKDIINNLLKLDFVIENDSKMTVEHSISGLVPFIKHYFSDAKIVPIALTRQLSLENLNNILSILVENLDIETTLFISSVDFSHYLSLEEANEKDKQSIEAISNKDLDTIMTFTNDNLDSPNSIMAMLNTMKLIEAKKIKLLNNSNSQIILNKKVQETTSYITFLFY
jgi:AmmeMemoRadiSam system protein B